MVSVEGRAYGQSFIAGSGLDPGAAKWSAREELSIGHAVERTSACHHEIFTGHAPVELVQKVEEHIFEAALHGMGKVHLALSKFRMRLTRVAEGFYHSIRK